MTHTYKAGRLQKSEASLTHEDQEQRGRRTAFLPAVNGILVLPCSVSLLFSVFTSCLLLCVQVHLEGRRQLWETASCLLPCRGRVFLVSGSIWQVSCPQASDDIHLHLSHLTTEVLGLKTEDYHTQLLTWVQGLELRSSGSHSKCYYKLNRLPRGHAVIFCSGSQPMSTTPLWVTYQISCIYIFTVCFITAKL